MLSKKPTSATPDTRQTYTLADLDGQAFPGTSLAVLGFPIQHSVSPVMHNAALQAMGQTCLPFTDWHYYRFEVRPGDLAAALPRFAAAGFAGLNLTIPHKVEAVPLVQEVVGDARLMGAVNTLKLDSASGRYTGHNTDGWGMDTAIGRDLKRSLKDATVLLLGAGGAARAAAVQCLAAGCRQLWIGNRNQERLGELLEVLKAAAPEASVTGFDLSAPPHDLPRRDVLIINATSLGLKAGDPAPLSLAGFEPSSTAVYDMVYSQKTALQQAAELAGIPAADGLSMLVWQGAKALQIWSGAEPPAQLMMAAACQALKLTPRHV